MTDRDTGEPLVGVTVVVEGSKVLSAQAAITGMGGRYALEPVPEGAVAVSFYYGESVVRSQVVVSGVATSVLDISIEQPKTSWGGCSWREPILEWTTARDYDVGKVEPRLLFFGDRTLRGTVRLDGFRLPAGVIAPPRALLSEIVVHEAGVSPAVGTGRTTALKSRSGSNEWRAGAALRGAYATEDELAGRALAHLSGPIATDHAWFGIGIETSAQQLGPRDGALGSGAARFDYYASPEHGFGVTLFGRRERTIVDQRSHQIDQHAGGVARWQSKLLDNRLVLSAGAGAFERGTTSSEATAPSSRQLRADAIYRFESLGRHEAKAGVEYVAETWRVPMSESGPQLPMEQTPGTDPVSTGELMAYALDSYDPLPNWRLTGGVRVDDAAGSRGDPNVSPRFGIAYDWTLEGRARVYAHVAANQRVTDVAMVAPVEPATETAAVAGTQYELLEDLLIGGGWERRGSRDIGFAEVSTRLRAIEGRAVLRYGEIGDDRSAQLELTAVRQPGSDSGVLAGARLLLGMDEPSELVLGYRYKRRHGLGFDVTVGAGMDDDEARIRLGLALDY